MAGEYKIPQNIDVEDKIIGPFTLKQFLYMIGGGVLVYFLFLSIGRTNLVLFLGLAVPIALAVLALVFIRVNERPFLSFLGYFIFFVLEPKIKRWEKSTKIKSIMMQGKAESEKSAKEVGRRTKKGLVRSRLDELAMIVDTKGWGGGEGEVNVAGRVASVVEATATVQTTLKETAPLEDVFEDLEAAMEKVTGGGAKEGKADETEDFSDLAMRLSGLISKK